MALLKAALGLMLFSIVALGDARKVQRIPSRPCLTKGYNNTIYDFTATDLVSGENITLSKYSGKVVLIANVATYWAFTNHYLGLNALQSKYSNGLVILAFPCNQFGLQEPGSNASEILNGVEYVRPGNGFKPNFQMFKKIDVNGDKEHPLFTYLKLHCPATRDGFSGKHLLFYEPFKNWDVRWNWEKFLIDRSGRPVMRYDASTEPSAISNDIENLINSSL